MKEDDNKKDNKKSSKIYYIIVLAILLIAIIAISIFLLGSDDEKQDENILAYTDLIKQVDEGKVEKVEMTVGSTTVSVKLKGQEEEKSAIVPNTQAFVELIHTKTLEGNEIELIQKEQNVMYLIVQYMFSLLPTILLIIMFVLIFKMQGMGSKGKVYDAETTKSKIKFEDVAGLEEEKNEMIEIVNFLKEPEKFYEMGAKIPRGVLLCGRPGTGKTLIAKAIAGEAKVPFISMSGSEFIEMFAGLGASRVRKLFEKAKKIAPCIVFIDEIDAIGSRRASGSGAETENNQTLNQLLVEMDGFDTEETIIVSFVSNPSISTNNWLMFGCFRFPHQKNLFFWLQLHLFHL